jgi:5-deoxy-glucuronate isomerase
MPKLIKNFDNDNHPMIEARNELLPFTYFNRLRLARGEEHSQQIPDFETVFVVVSGNCDIEVKGEMFADVGKRADVWAGRAESVYASTGAQVRVVANLGDTEILVAGGFCSKEYPAFRIKPEEVEMVEVGSSETHSRRRIFHILGQNAEGRAGNLLVSELFCDAGCWAGYPPHKHDTDIGTEETAFEEVYHYRFAKDGFGVQLAFQENGDSECYMIHDGDTAIVDKGYHPSCTAPGYEMYFFTILVGKTQRSLVQNFKEEHRHLLNKIPGINAMRDKFK